MRHSAIEELSHIECRGPLRSRFLQIRNSSMRVPSLPSFIFGDVPAAVLERFHSHAGLPRQGAWFVHDVEVTGDYLIKSGDKILKDHLSNIHEVHVAQALELHSKSGTQAIRRQLRGQHVL